MLESLAYIFLGGLFLGFLAKKLGFPPLLGMLIVGIALGPFGLGMLDDKLLSISAELRKIALVIILTRAGLNLNLADLKKVGRPAILLCFLPACFEIAAMMVFAPLFFGISLIEAGILGAVVAAVSPAVIVPKMLKLMEEGRGTAKAIPQMIMAGASVDDVFVIVLFTAFLGLEQGQGISINSFVQIPVAIVLGILAGLLCGGILGKLFQKFHLRDSVKVVLLLSISFLLTTLEDKNTTAIGFSGLIGVMAMGLPLQKIVPQATVRVANKYGKLWVAAELLLFVLVGATVDISYAVSAGALAIAIIFLVLIFRMAGVAVCLLGTKLTRKERLFTMVAYCPKATVQAAIGSIPLAAGLGCGNLVLTVAVLAILLTAPLGAFFIDFTYQKWLDI